MNMTLTFAIHPTWKPYIEDTWPDWKDTSDRADLTLQFALNDGKLLNDMHELRVTRETGEQSCIIPVLSIRELFRGNVNPGNLGNTQNVKYMYIITFVEKQWISFVNQQLIDVPRDITMHEIYSQLRRRPDSSTHVSDTIYSIIWDSFAFLAGIMEISEAEFTACVSRLVHSASTFHTSIASTNMYERLTNVYCR